ncbi:MAG: glycine cleavage system protein T, partial [Planctomycetes bacterium]|nr:glycine cleavage system protein T [Planctomycetota bacterium]
MVATEQQLKTPLYDTHIELGARMVEFAGWSMPVQYRSIREEHLHTRSACSLFDVSHMGRLKLKGRDAGSLLDRLCTRNLADADVGRSYYSHICREDGGILDDVIVSRFEDHWGIVCNASNRDKITAWITKHAEGLDAELTDETTVTAMIAL